MNALNLKITGDTRKKGKKREEKEDLTQFYPQNGVGQCILDTLCNSNSMEGQISALKMILSSYKGCSDNEYEVREVSTLFLNMVFCLKTRSPLRAAILRHFSTVENNVKSIINSRLVEFLEEKFLSSITNEVEYTSQLLTFLMSWLEIGSFSLAQCAYLVSSELIRSLLSLQTSLSSEMPPTTKLLVIETLHNNVRCLIAFFQKVSADPTIELYECTLALLKDEQLPLDTRSNSGILLVLECKELFPDIEGRKLLDKIGLQDDFQSLLCLYSGILNVYGEQQMEIKDQVKQDDTSLLDYLLQKIILAEESNPADCTLVLTATRCILLVTKSLILSPHLLSKRMLSSLLNFIWVHLEHYMDAVRHLSHSSLTNVVSAGKQLKNNFVTYVILEAIGNMTSDKRGKHAAILALIGNLPVVYLLSESPGLVCGLLETAKSSQSANHVIGSYEALATQHFQEKANLDEWRSMWVMPLINTFSNDRPNAAFEHILENLIKLDSGVVHYVASLDNLNFGASSSVLFICLRIGKKRGVLLKNSDDSKWKGLVDYKIIMSHLLHSDGDVRLACFALVVETQKLSELFTREELEIVKQFLKYNVGNQCPAERQSALAYFKKFLSRFKLGLDACRRGLHKNCTTANYETKTLFESYENFADWLVQFCVDNLFPGANFARRCEALNWLSLSHEFGLWEKRRHTEENSRLLMMCFLDSFEENKNLAKKILLNVSPEVLGFTDPFRIKWYLDSSVDLASSIRPVDSLSAAYFVSLLASFPSVAPELLSSYSHLLPNRSLYYELIPDLGRFLCVTIVLDKLKRELAISQANLLKGASSGPMYGQIFVLRHILNETEFSLVVDSQDWKDVIQEIVIVAFNCNDVVSCVVNSSSPEGHLPMDFDYETNNLIEDADDSSKVTAQMLLLCSWRTVKEVSLLLGELSESIPISTNGEKGLVSEEQILEIGEHLSGLLAETKHRGAFEQAYVGFCKLASRLWRYSKGNLHELPSRWLDETLEEISNNQTLSTTRRSAGIPFRFQALVCTELDVGGGRCFHRGIKTLLQLAGDSTSSVETKCHALNILRALYRHTLLGEMVSPYVAQGLTIAIQGYNASTWAERNSSTLLLSALMTRVFGVSRSRSENLCWKNKMTGRIFFQRYPSLFGVLLDHLESASQKSFYPATYPALLILGRLYPSSLEGTDSNLQLNKYIPLVYNCSGSNILKTRVLASSAMVALITPNLFVNHVDTLCSSLHGNLNENSTHGLLLQVLRLFRSSNHLPEDVVDSIRLKLDSWMRMVIDVLKSDRRSFVSKTTCISILLVWVTRYHWDASELSEYLNSSILSMKLKEEMCGQSVFLLYSTILSLTISYHLRQIERLISCVLHFLRNSNYDVRRVCLDFLCCLLRNVTNFTLKADESFEIDFEVTEYTQELKWAINNSDELAMAILSNLDSTCHHEDTSALLSVAKFLPKIVDVLNSRKTSLVEYFGEICFTESESLGSLAFQCIVSSLSRLDSLNHLTSSDIDQLCLIIDSYSTPESDSSCRKTVATFLSLHFDNLVNISSEKNNLKIWTTTLRLLNDDNYDIRELLGSAFEPNVIPSVAVSKLMDKLLSSGSVNSIVKTCLLLRWANWDSHVESSVEDPVDRVFEKGDMNTYLEEKLINEMACDRLRLLLSEQPSLITQKLPNYCYDWLCSNNKLSSNDLIAVISSWKRQIEDKRERDDRRSPFRPNEIGLSLLEKKLATITNCLPSSVKLV